MTDIEKLLAERKTQHGDFTDHARLTQALKTTFFSEAVPDRFTPCQREAIEMILHKLGCIGAGNPAIEDHWRDIAGYATLVAQRLPAP